MAVLILLFYMEDRWAYMISTLAPAAWLVMAFATGMLGVARAAMRPYWTARHPLQPGQPCGRGDCDSEPLMIAAAGRHWRREYAGLGKSLSTFAVSFGLVAVSYTILVVWFWHLIPRAAATR